jgi:hypothetical protein
MKRLVLGLLIGVSAGYFYGFGDAQKHETNVVARAVTRFSSHHGELANDVDKTMQRAEH